MGASWNAFFEIFMNFGGSYRPKTIKKTIKSGIFELVGRTHAHVQAAGGYVAPMPAALVRRAFRPCMVIFWCEPGSVAAEPK